MAHTEIEECVIDNDGGALPKLSDENALQNARDAGDAHVLRLDGIVADAENEVYASVLIQTDELSASEKLLVVGHVLVVAKYRFFLRREVPKDVSDAYKLTLLWLRAVEKTGAGLNGAARRKGGIRGGNHTAAETFGVRRRGRAADMTFYHGDDA